MKTLSSSAADILKLPPNVGSKGSRWKVPSADDIRALRKRLGLTQAQFSEMYSLSVDSVKSWETGRSVPEQANCLILGLIDHDPERMLDLFNDLEAKQVISAYRLRQET